MPGVGPSRNREQRAVAEIDCPKCGARIGYPCIRSCWLQTGIAYCSKCGARIGYPCIRVDGTPGGLRSQHGPASCHERRVANQERRRREAQ
jgi:hypothetical protein